MESAFLLKYYSRITSESDTTDDLPSDTPARPRGKGYPRTHFSIMLAVNERDEVIKLSSIKHIDI
jgi:hypothetical protein